MSPLFAALSAKLGPFCEVKQACEVTGLEERTIRKYMATGVLTPYHINDGRPLVKPNGKMRRLPVRLDTAEVLSLIRPGKVSASTN